ncbi:MAG: hypothetical protein EAZ36_03095 [Verrucomicrobia bacterium]|nr:MAG: hypothetical protein EAZ36_03095 [Verrucomicrobiota bacterium]
MNPRSRLTTRRLLTLLALLNFGALPALVSNRAISAPLPCAANIVVDASDLIAQPNASAAQRWLETCFPVGTTLADAPHFFAAAQEVFYDAEESLLFFVYRSSEPDQWTAWIGFDPERGVVTQAAAISH